MRTRGLAILVATMALVGVAASPAAASHDPNCLAQEPANPGGATSVWTEPQCLSVLEQDGEVPQVAIADDGSALAVWGVNDPDAAGPPSAPGSAYRIKAAFRRRGENFVPVNAPGGFISSATRNARPWIRLKMNKRGDAIVVWEAVEDNGKIGVRSAYKPFDGDFGAEQVVRNEPGDPSFTHDFVEPEVGIDGDGDATVLFHQPPNAPFDVTPATGGSAYSARSRPGGAGSSWGADEIVTPHDPSSDAVPVHYTETEGALAVNEAGDRIAQFTSERFSSGDNARQVVRVAVKDAADADWDMIAEHDTGVTDEEVFSTHLAYSNDGSHRISLWAEGTALHSSYTTNQNNINTPFPGPGSDRFGAAAGIDSGDDALALWSDGAGLRANFANPPATFNAIADGSPISGNPGSAPGRTRPALAADNTGQQVAVFQEKVGSDEIAQAAVRPPGGLTQFAAPIRLSADPASGDLDLETDDSNKKHTGPQIAMNSTGEGVAAWSMSDGLGNLVVQVSLLVPSAPDDPDDPDDPGVIPLPPPPPPRPKPAVPSTIQLARGLARDNAVVLIANVTGAVDQLQWSFDSKDEPPIVGKVEGGELQRTVRLRLPNNSFTARVKTVGADGTRNFTRSFTSLKPSSSPETQEAVASLKRVDTPPVFAVGKKETLTGESDQCSPSTVWSGQQKIEGCFKPVEDLVDIPSLERGAVHELAKSLKLDETKKELMDKATELSDGYVAEGKALLNDEFPVLPTDAADVLTLPQAKSLISAKAELPIGSASFNPRDGFNLKVDPKKVKIPLGKLPNPPKLPRLGGLEIVGDWDVDLDKQEAKIRASVVLPKAITKAGLKIENQVVLRATAERVIIDEVTIGPIDADVGALKVKQFKLQYKREPDEWLGQGKACVISGSCLDMAPPNGKVLIKNGELAFAGATIQFPTPGIPLFKGVFLERIGFGLGLDPTRMTGSARIGVVHLIAIDGRLFLAFPSSRTPFILKRDEVGNDFPGHLYGASFTRPTVGVSGAFSIKVPELGDIKLGSGYAMYEYPGYIAFGGGYDINLIEIVQLRGGMSGELDIDKERFNIGGNIEACLIGEICGSAIGNISRGPNSAGGAGGCITVRAFGESVSVGGGVQWRDVSDPFIWPFDGCKWSKFRIDVRSASARSAQAGGAYTLDVKNGAPSPALKLYGQGGPPRVRVRGPAGQQLDGTADKNLDLSPGGKIRIIRFEGNKDAGPFTVVGFQNAQPGRYTVTPLPSSPPITRTARATDPPDAKVSGRVTGKGRRRVLRYNVLDRQDQRVTFQEVEKGGQARTIGATTKGGRGRIRFRTAPGSSRRLIVAQFALAGVNAERKMVTSFQPPSMQLPTPKRVRVRRKGTRVLVSWRKVKGATRYEVAARLQGRRQVFASTRRTRVVLRGVPRWLSGRVTVRAIDDLRQSAVGGRPSFKRTGRRPSPFRALQHCDLRRRDIVCRPSAGRFGSGNRCLPQRLAVSGRRIGPARLGASYRAFFRRYSAFRPGRRATSFCVRGGGRFLVSARKRKIAFIATTAPGHRTSRVGPGDELQSKLPGSKRILRTVLVGHRQDPGRVVYGVLGRQVRFLAVARRGQALSGRAIGRKLRGLGFYP